MDFDVAYQDSQYSNFVPVVIGGVHIANQRKYKREIEANKKEVERLRAESDRLIAEAKQKALEAERIAKEEAEKAAAALKESEAAQQAMKAAQNAFQTATDVVASQSTPQIKKYAPYIVGGAIVLGLYLLLRK